MGGKYNSLEWFAWPWIDPPLIHPDDIDAWIVRNNDGVRESAGYSCYTFRLEKISSVRVTVERYDGAKRSNERRA